jgi:hypothetical protein
MAAVDFSQFTGIFYGWLKSGVFWVIVAVVLTCGTILILWWRKRTRLKYNIIEVVSFGNGKIGANMFKAGIFKQKETLMGLWDYGLENRFKLADGRIIWGADTSQLHDIFGKKGFIVRRKDDDPKILVPIDKVIWNYKAVCTCPYCNRRFKKEDKLDAPLFEVAPGDYRQASVEIIKDAINETQGLLEKYLPYIMLGAIVVFFVISMILASQFFNRTVDKASELLLKAGQQAGQIQSSTTAP